MPPSFGFSAREAEIIDPQQRVFLECAWEALEEAGCDPGGYPGAIGVFAGAGMNTYVINLLSRPKFWPRLALTRRWLGTTKTFCAAALPTN